ncbi:UPF0182 family membrane protein [Nesterenkonia halotolerans]|uniref:UPF0182 protein H4W26_001071 n=1 Tax=Nesterenkonia halotolerans TaxID=225325 RepID=A0ABR9J6W7_9MICC|nr:UPF0182 family protein [Nesterenkonia halotolerans]MBE1514316.1 uncharacterized membrane protein (UPF0182 family) [Nesterenkonia halotolerans]
MSFSQGFGSANPFGGGLFGSGSGGDDGDNSGGSGSERRERGSGPRRPSALVLTIIIIAVLIGAFVASSGFYAEILWFNQLGYQDVFWTERIARGVIFLVAFVLMAALVWLSLFLAFRNRPMSVQSQMNESVIRYQRTLNSMRRLFMIGLPALMGFFAGTAAQGSWETVLLFINQQPFGMTDPEFGMDFGFFIFTLPFLGLLNGFLVSAVLVAGIAGILTHYLFGGIRIEPSGKFVVETAARWHIAVTAAIFLLLQAVNWWLDRYATLQNQSGNWAGALYTDVNAVIPAQAILAAAAVLVALVFIVTAVTGRWRFSIIGSAMLLITAIIGGGLYPFLVQEYQVQPSERTLEMPYIERNMELTRYAYGLQELEQESYDADSSATEGALAEDAGNTENIRLLDPNLVSAAFGQFQQFRQYYSFPDTLSFDRYEIDGERQDTVIAARELNIPDDASWVNRHLVYTHGYGLVAANANTVTPEGRPSFTLQGIPTRGELASDDDYEPRIYFGENSPEYSIVGAPEEEEPLELDRPAAADSEAETVYTFEGDGGPDVGGLFNRLVYAIQFQSPEILLSGDMTEESQILYERQPRERVQEVAPFLEVDQNAYPAIVDGRVKWIVEGYTTSNDFPYSDQQQLEQATTDALTQGAPTLAGQVNYIRNSVKATVDAYDGSVELYAWDTEDPILRAWQEVFPEALQPYENMSAELMDHVRYPEDMFRVQRELLGRYHVTDPGTFYENNDAWSVPSDPTADDESAQTQPPYYMTLQMPGQEEPAFSLTGTFIPQIAEGAQQRNVLYGFLAAAGDAGTGEDGVKAEDYGQLRLLELPRDTVIPGPGQTQANFDSNSQISQELNLLRQGASEVINGNMITLPAGDGILYVQPVYVQSTGTEAAYPALRKVLVAYGEEVGFADTLDEALDQVFGGDSGAAVADGAGVEGEAVDDELDVPEGEAPSDEAPAEEEPADEAEPTEEAEAPAAPTGPAQERLNDALDRAGQAIQDSDAALSDGDFAAYGEAQEQLQQAIDDALQAEADLEE